MNTDTEFQARLGTALATFAAGGTYSAQLQLNGRLIGLYSDNFPVAPGSITFRASYTPAGTGYPVQTADGTVLKVLAFGSGTYYQMNTSPWTTQGLMFTTLQIPAGGTTGAGGGTIVLVTERV